MKISSNGVQLNVSEHGKGAIAVRDFIRNR